MIQMSLAQYADLTDNLETKLDEADEMAKNTDERLSHETVFKNVRKGIS